MVDKIPFAVVFDGAEALAVKVHVHGHQSWFQEPENRIIGSVVEVAAGDDVVDAGRRQRICQEPQPLHGNAATWLRYSRSAVFGWVVVHQDGELG